MPLSLRESAIVQHRLPRNDDLLMWRAELLSKSDRVLVDAILVQGQSTQSIAALTGKSVKAIRDRLHRLTRRMASREFMDAARALPYLDSADAQLTRLRFCEGASQRQLCMQLELTAHQLRRQLDRISGQIKSMKKAAGRADAAMGPNEAAAAKFLEKFHAAPATQEE